MQRQLIEPSALMPSVFDIFVKRNLTASETSNYLFTGFNIVLLIRILI